MCELKLMLIFADLIKEVLHAGLFDPLMYVSLHGICLPSACWAIYNNVTVFAFNKSFAEFLAAFLKDLLVCGGSIIDILEMVVLVACLKVGAS
jgi:hypothetical protein